MEKNKSRHTFSSSHLLPPSISNSKKLKNIPLLVLVREIID
jgi:hypothetical protein